MAKNIPEFNADAVEEIERQSLSTGFFKLELRRLRHKLFGGGWSEEIKREVFLRGNAAAAVLYDPKNDLIALVEQFRVGAMGGPLGPWCLEVVAGMIEPGSTPEAVIKREIKEEADVDVQRLEYICNYLSSPGGSDERIYLYCGICDLSNAGGIHGLDDENEDIRVCVFDSETVFGNLMRDKITDFRIDNATTLIALHWLQLHRNRLRHSP